jgi:polar amino acid transport system substrate-binding protein
MNVRRGALAVFTLAILLLAACATPSQDATKAVKGALAPPPPPPSLPTTTTTGAPSCDPTASLRPASPLPAPGQMPTGSTMAAIQKQGHLVVGVDQSTFRFGYRDPRTGQIQGFDIDVAREIARAIFGDPNAIELHALNSADRLPAVENKDGHTPTVDMVVSQVSMTCGRWQDVDFSSVYYLAHQALLVRLGSGIAGVPDLEGKTVCVTKGSTSEDNIKKLLATDKVNATIDEVESRADCLVHLQDGKADAITSDDTILTGFHLQDQLTQLLDASLHDEPYGIAIPQGNEDFVRFVNGVLDQMRSDGRWQAIDEKWLSSLGPAPSPPTPTYKA